MHRTFFVFLKCTIQGGPKVDALLTAFLHLWLKFWEGIDKYWIVPVRKLFYFHHCVKPIAVGYVKVTDPRCIICSLYTTLMSKTFPQESSEAFFNLKQSALPRTKKLHQRVLTECFEKHFAKKTWFHLASQKRNFLALSHLF